MKRSNFIKALAVLPFMTTAMKLDALQKLTEPFGSTPQMPVLFLGHGSPMNAIEDNEFVHGWQKIGRTLPKPSAILCISAHWETNGTFVTAMERPKTIHDFGGFPQALFDVEYPAPGSPELAAETKKIITSTTVGLDDKWGLDHGAWSVIKHLYPIADVPVIQMSLDYRKPAAYHYELAKELMTLRNKGVLIIGSGNMVHNLGTIAWDKIKEPEYGFDWAIEANERLKRLILTDDHKQLINYQSLGREVALAAPSPDHFLPLIYALALKTEKESISLFNDKLVMGSISMLSFKIS
ncbi:MAG: 4,5-DOPA dioxygenase extradiol [Flavipsychrobacter sp.]|nr:4,5-DOPA dioxygenase extradiol [Flavipsychrobacter sp.]